MKIADFLVEKIIKSIEVILVLIFAILVLDVLWQVFSRYVIKSSFSWTEELARFSLIWLSVLGAAYLSAKKEHLSMDFLFDKLKPTSQKKVSIIIEICIILFAFIVMFLGGSNLVYTTLYLEQLSGTLRIPLGYIYAIMPLSGILIILFSIYNIFKIINTKQESNQ